MFNIVKKLLAACLVILITAVLSGCGEEEGKTNATGLKQYDGGEYSLNVNPDWQVVTPTEFQADIPKETLVAFTSPEAYNGFFMNVNVIRENLNQAVNAVDYARANINLSAQNLTDYEKIQEAKIDIGDTPSFVHIFQARLNPAEKRIRFIQLYATQGNYGYIITGGMLPDTPQELRDQVGAMVTSFQLK